MRCTLVVAAALALTAPSVATAQTPGEEAAVLAAVQRLFDAMAARDSAAARSVLLEGGSFTAVTVGSGPAAASHALTPHAALPGRIAAAAEPWHERMWEPRVEVHGPIAMVWTPYDFRRGESFSHCGVDGFTLVRTEEGWRIASAVYTVEREGCVGPGPR